MGLLDSILGAAAPAGGGSEVLLQVLGSLMQGRGGNGLAGLLQQLTQGGLGDAVQSWVGTGQNMPVSSDQLHAALGADTMGALAQQAGMSSSDLGGQLAQLLPQLVDKMTPNGQMPQPGTDLGGMLGGLLGGLLNRG